jgi:recombination DNA repair RAD52 pathway protein
MTLYNDLSAPFPPEMERELRKGGTSLVYIPVSEVITRLNKVLGVDKWSFDIVSCQRDSLDPDYVVAHVRITWHTGENVGWVTRDGFGGQKIKRTKQGDIVDLGDEMKGAVSDALKKAAQTLGIGLYLARSEDAIEIEEVIAASQAPISAGEIERLELWENFMGLAKSLSPEQKEQLNNHWKQYSGGRPKPTKTTATVDELTELIGACVQVSFGPTEQSDE